MSPKPIYVTKPSLPPLDEFIPYLEEIWKSGVLTNGGQWHQKLELALSQYLDVPYVSLFSNGTAALIAALQALKISGDVITTPYSFVATSHAILWAKCKPVFVDIDSGFNIDVKKIERAITENTTAILAVHCYGNPCNVDEIERIAHKWNLKVIYDAAHAFGVSICDRSVLNYGDLSVLSFHATKVFSTFEGGAVISHNPQMKSSIDRLKNFGFENEVTVSSAGTNAKLNEVSAAFGLLNLRYIDNSIQKRQSIDLRYRALLSGIRGIFVPPIPDGVKANYSYFPILVNEDFALSRDELYVLFKQKNIFARRYFYPLITHFPMYSHLETAANEGLQNAVSIENKVICLPIYEDLTESDLSRILDVIIEASKGSA